MLRRASDLAARARARIRAAREHDPYGWDERLDDRAPLSHEDVYRAEPIDFVQIPDDARDDDAGTTTGTPAGVHPAPARQPGARRPRRRRRRRPGRRQRTTAGRPPAPARRSAPAG